MSCADELNYIRTVRIPERMRLLKQAQDYRDGLQTNLTEALLMIAALQARGVGGVAVASSLAQAQAAPAQRQATARGEERRAGDGEMAQYAALLRDIEDMEARLDKLETK